MEIRYVILARYAEFTPDGRLNLLGGDTNQFVAEVYPYVHSTLIAAARLVLEPEDFAREHSIRAFIEHTESGEVIAEGLNGTIPIFNSGGGSQNIGTGFILTFSSVIFPTEGRYALKILVDGEEMGKAPMRVAPLAFYQATSGITVAPRKGDESDGPSERDRDQ